MEFPHSLVQTERWLAVCAAGVLLLSGLIEFFSPFSQTLRSKRPWVIEDKNGFSIVHEGSQEEKIFAQGSQRREMEGIFKGLGIEVHDWRLSPQSFSGNLNRFLFWMKARALKLGEVDRVSLSVNPKTDQELAAKLLYPPRTDSSLAVVTEIMNASKIPGLATEAEKVLRLNGMDVVSVGNSETNFTRTVVYDRTGNPSAAWRVWRALGCLNAREETLVDSKNLVDVSVFLAADCPLGATSRTLNLKRIWRNIFFAKGA